MCESLAQIPYDKPVSILLRHSIREHAPHGQVSYKLPLTEEGIELANWWGEQLNRPIHGLYSSPVERCRDTAEWLAKGAGVELHIENEKILVEPGCYVLDGYKANPSFQSLGPVAFTNAFLNEEVPGMESPLKGAYRILEYLESRQSELPSFSLHVTHDTILAAFVYGLIKQELQESDWPEMLEGTFVWFEDEMIHLLWRGKIHLVPRSLFADKG